MNEWLSVFKLSISKCVGTITDGRHCLRSFCMSQSQIKITQGAWGLYFQIKRSIIKYACIHCRDGIHAERETRCDSSYNIKSPADSASWWRQCVLNCFPHLEDHMVHQKEWRSPHDNTVETRRPKGWRSGVHLKLLGKKRKRAWKSKASQPCTALLCPSDLITSTQVGLNEVFELLLSTLHVLPQRVDWLDHYGDGMKKSLYENI